MSAADDFTAAIRTALHTGLWNQLHPKITAGAPITQQDLDLVVDRALALAQVRDAAALAAASNAAAAELKQQADDAIAAGSPPPAPAGPTFDQWTLAALAAASDPYRQFLLTG
jgi:hypothetical protein